MGAIFSLIENKDRTIYILLMILIVYLFIMELWSIIYLLTPTKDDNKSKINYLRSLNTTPTVIHSTIIIVSILFNLALFFIPPFRFIMMANDVVSSTSTAYKIDNWIKSLIFISSILTFIIQGKINNINENNFKENDFLNTKYMNLAILTCLLFFMILNIYNNSKPTSQK
jgi:hypothetical protein